MATKDIGSEFKSVFSFLPVAITTANPTGTTVDCAGYNSVAIELSVGIETGTSNSFRIEHSDLVGSGHVMVADADIDADAYTTNKADLVVTVSNDVNIYRWRYRGNKRFIRVNSFANTSGAITFGANVILGYPKSGPVASWNV